MIFLRTEPSEESRPVDLRCQPPLRIGLGSQTHRGREGEESLSFLPFGPVVPTVELGFGPLGASLALGPPLLVAHHMTDYAPLLGPFMIRGV